MTTEQEVPKYKKSKDSNISKSNRKTKHKHKYEECIIQYPFTFAGKNNIRTQLCSYCTICGKIGDRFKEDKSIVKDYERIVKSPINGVRCYSIISGEELYEKYHDKMPVFFIEGIYKEKYVDLEQNNNLNGE